MENLTRNEILKVQGMSIEEFATYMQLNYEQASKDYDLIIEQSPKIFNSYAEALKYFGDTPFDEWEKNMRTELNL